MAKRGRRGSTISRLPALAISAGAGAVLLAIIFGWDLGMGRSRAGKVLGTTAGFNPTGDLDGDGVSNAKDRDDDNDGWSDVNDPLPLSKSDLDNDGLSNGQDTDDDGDGILDKNDRVYDASLNKYVDLSWDQNNNKKTDTEERANSRDFDGDGDGRPDLTELHEVVKAQAAKLGIAVSAQAKTLADYPQEALQNLPHGWWYVCNDADNDGVPKGLDRDDRKRAGNYAHYADGGQWEKTYALYDDKGDVFGFISKCVGCTTVKNFSVPTFISGGGDHSWGRGKGSRPHASFYKKYEEGFFGKFSGHYRSLPQYHGGVYVEAAGSAAQGEGGAHSGGSWFSHVGGGHTGGGGTLGGGGGGGHISGGGGGGGGGGTYGGGAH